MKRLKEFGAKRIDEIVHVWLVRVNEAFMAIPSLINTEAFFAGVCEAIQRSIAALWRA